MTMITKIISLQILLLTACVFVSFFLLHLILSAPLWLNISQPLPAVSLRSPPMSFSTSELVWPRKIHRLAVISASITTPNIRMTMTEWQDALVCLNWLDGIKSPVGTGRDLTRRFLITQRELLLTDGTSGEGRWPDKTDCEDAECSANKDHSAKRRVEKLALILVSFHCFCVTFSRTC